MREGGHHGQAGVKDVKVMMHFWGMAAARVAPWSAWARSYSVTELASAKDVECAAWMTGLGSGQADVCGLGRATHDAEPGWKRGFPRSAESPDVVGDCNASRAGARGCDWAADDASR